MTRRYKSGLTTELPDPAALRGMLDRDFRGTAKNLGDKIDSLRALGVEPGARVLDFGASWGYGVWQLSAAGYTADGFELSASRAAWGRRHLGVTIASSQAALADSSYDAAFTNHVLEHVGNPRAAFERIARLLKPGGFMVAFFPNGSEACRVANPVRFHCNWGRLHPIYLTDEVPAPRCWPTSLTGWRPNHTKPLPISAPCRHGTNSVLTRGAWRTTR